MVRQSNGWAQLLDADSQLVKALSAVQADAMERRIAAARSGEAQVAAAWGQSGRNRGDERNEQPKPGKVVELKLGQARLQGSERDVDDFLRELERAGAVA